MRNNFSLGLHAEFSVREVNNRDGIKDQTLPTQRPAAIFVRFVPGLGSSMRKQFT